ncbi:MAG: hypothetical protein IJC24_04515 [Clostridia bacterium]|nr:hypothetical protein [Clostridia bacterium]
MKKKKTVPLHIPVLWFIVSAIWILRLCVDLHNGKQPDILEIAVVGMSLACAAVNLKRYLEDKKEQREE